MNAGAITSIMNLMRSSAYYNKKRKDEEDGVKNNDPLQNRRNIQLDYKAVSIAKELNAVNTINNTTITSSGTNIIVWYINGDYKCEFKFTVEFVKMTRFIDILNNIIKDKEIELGL